VRIKVRNNDVFASTGGRNFDPVGNVVLFIHGSGQSQLGFMLQHRFFANRGFQCITPDMPGHGLSKGDPLKTIEEMADWYVEFMQTMGVNSASLVGHSMGGLIELAISKVKLLPR
jgi:pimeloyl-ACP methyl ester carboxylesterase